MVTELLLVASLCVNVLCGLALDRRARQLEKGWQREDGLRQMVIEWMKRAGVRGGFNEVNR